MAEPDVPVELVEPVVVQDPPVVEPNADVHEEPILEPNPQTTQPLQPGGQRFEQVYALRKQAERDRDAERERRIRAEAQLELLTKSRTPAEKVYDWPELEAMIAQGQITRADAQRHREDVVRETVKRELKNDLTKETTESTRINALSKGIYDYVVAIPDLQNAENATRQRVDREFDWLVSVQGRDPATLGPAERKALELTALRTVLGPIESLAKRTASPHAETHQGFTGGIPPSRTANPDQKLLDALTPQQVEYYNKMFKVGKYPNKWKDVVEELKYNPATRKRK